MALTAAEGIKPENLDEKEYVETRPVTTSPRNRDRYVRACAVALAVLLIAGVLLRTFEAGSSVSVPGLTVLAVPVAYTLIPLLGYVRSLRRLRRHEEA